MGGEKKEKKNTSVGSEWNTWEIDQFLKSKY